MLYPNNIELKEKSRIKKLREKVIDIKNKMKAVAKYWIFDRSNLLEIISIKFHI